MSERLERLNRQAERLEAVLNRAALLVERHTRAIENAARRRGYLKSAPVDAGVWRDAVVAEHEEYLDYLRQRERGEAKHVNDIAGDWFTVHDGPPNKIIFQRRIK